MKTTLKFNRAVLCPHCGEEAGTTVEGEDSLFWEDGSASVQYCRECGGGYRGLKEGDEVFIEKLDERVTMVLDLLRFKGTDRPTYFVVETQRRLHPGELYDPARDKATVKHHYEQLHPDAWIKQIRHIVLGAHDSPIGLVEFIRGVEVVDLDRKVHFRDINSIFEEVQGLAEED